MKKYVLFSLLSSVLLWGSTISDEAADKAIKAQRQEMLQMVVSEMSKQMPQKVDDYTMLVSVKSQGYTLINTYEINTGAKSDSAVIRDDKERMERAVTHGSCSSAKRFLENDIDLEYIYNNAITKAELFRFLVSRQKCGY